MAVAMMIGVCSKNIVERKYNYIERIDVCGYVAYNPHR